LIDDISLSVMTDFTFSKKVHKLIFGILFFVFIRYCRFTSSGFSPTLCITNASNCYVFSSIISH